MRSYFTGSFCIYTLINELHAVRLLMWSVHMFHLTVHCYCDSYSLIVIIDVSFVVVIFNFFLFKYMLQNISCTG